MHNSNNDILHCVWNFDRNDVKQKVEYISPYIEEKGQLSQKLAGRKSGYGVMIAVKLALHDTQKAVQKGGGFNSSLAAISLMREPLVKVVLGNEEGSAVCKAFQEEEASYHNTQ